MRLPVRVKPGSSRTAVGGTYGDPPALIVAVTARAVDGQANAAVALAVAAALGVRRSDVRIAGGAASRSKVLEVPDACREAVAALLDLK